MGGLGWLILIGIALYFLHKKYPYLFKMAYWFPAKQRIPRDNQFTKMVNDGKKETDRILDKISKSGYKSLSKGELAFLAKQSKK